MRKPRIPSVWKHRSIRYDRSRFYMCLMWSLLISTSVLFFAPKRVPLVVALDQGLVHLLAGVLGVGTCFCVTGFTLGSRFFFPNADLRTAYKLAIYATPSNVAALSVFILMIGRAARWEPILTLYSGASTGFILLAHLWTSWDLYWEVWRINRRIDKAVTTATQRAAASYE